MCPLCGGEEEVNSPIRILEEEIDDFFFACVFKFKQGVELDEPLSHSTEKEQDGLLTIVGDPEFR